MENHESGKIKKGLSAKSEYDLKNLKRFQYGFPDMKDFYQKIQHTNITIPMIKISHFRNL